MLQQKLQILLWVLLTIQEKSLFRVVFCPLQVWREFLEFQYSLVMLDKDLSAYSLMFPSFLHYPCWAVSDSSILCVLDYYCCMALCYLSYVTGVGISWGLHCLKAPQRASKIHKPHNRHRWVKSPCPSHLIHRFVYSLICCGWSWSFRSIW